MKYYYYNSKMNTQICIESVCKDCSQLKLEIIVKNREEWSYLGEEQPNKVGKHTN